MRTARWREAGIAAASVGLVCAVAFASPDEPSPGILSGMGPSAPATPLSRPYILGWEAAVSSAPGLLRSAYEPGGVAVDPRTGWVYAATREGRLVCLEGGVRRWDVDLGGSLFAAPAVFEDSVVAGTGEGVLVVLNKVTGERRGRAVLGEELVTAPVIVRPAKGAPRAYVGSSADTLFAVDLDLGQRLWRAHRDAPTPFSVHGFAKPVVTPEAVYVAFADGWVEARSAVDGQLRWEKKLSPPGDLIDVDALGTNGQLLFAASASGGVYALELATGAIVWRQPMPGAGRLKVDGASVFAVAPGVIRSLRAGDGKLVWAASFGTRMGTTPVVAEGLVVVAEEDGPMFFFDERAGTPLASFGTGAGFETGPACSGRVLYALSNGGRVYSLSLIR